MYKTVLILFGLVSTSASGAILINEDFESYSGGGFDVNGFANVGSTNGLTIAGVSASLAGSGWNGNTGSQAFLEIASAGGNTAAKAFGSSMSADLNQNGLVFVFSLTETSTLKFSADYGAIDLAAGLYWEIMLDATMSGSSALTPMGDVATYETQFTLGPGSYSLTIGSSSVISYSGTHVDNIRLETVPEMSSSFLLLLGGVLVGLRRSR